MQMEPLSYFWGYSIIINVQDTGSFFGEKMCDRYVYPFDPGAHYGV